MRSPIARLALAAATGLMLLAPLLAQEHTKTAAAKAKVEEAKAAVAAKDTAKAVALLKEAIELDPDLATAHDQFDRAASRGEREKAYAQWTEKYPTKAIFFARAADANLYDDFRKSEEYAKRAVQIDPKCGQAYHTLSLIAEASGDVQQQQAYLKKAVDAAPEDPSWFFYYTASLQHLDPALYRSQLLEVAKRFPNDERGAQALYCLALTSANREDAIRNSLLLKNSFPPAKFGWSEDGMSYLVELYSESDPSKALALAKEMLAAKPNDKDWSSTVAYSDALVRAAQFVSAGRAADAVTVLDAVKLPWLQIASPYYLAKAAAQDAAGDTEKAYQTLLGQMGRSPTDGLKAALMKTGAKLHKSESQASADLWSLLQSKAKPATDLDTTRFGDETKVSLADYRGKVVLLNFWYPLCGPCRMEFPYMQAVLDKCAANGFVILSPNVEPQQDQFVLPYMKGMHWGFIPLHSNEDFAGKAYGARGFPSNFLIDRQGRVVYKPGVITSLDAQRTLELQIETVLEQGGK